ncbi:MAG: class I SAM-dependent methyltransferase [Methanospirillum sp.]|uniref:class I SAM-dependent methyltransferase n=1 Tax=Methanospirillum sp. TaxID=45200 RepID=UPI00236D56B0|nr:class I SAM-dependent methyltransferase [Methanospirillum sp.]MDD1729522.1 class I SAM-dependent methyltransferase [Methanospirillum sp.]
MLFLSDREKSVWTDYAKEILQNEAIPEEYTDKIRSNLQSAFYYYIGTMLASEGQQERGEAWLHAGTLCEEEGLFSSTFLMGFLQRHHGKMNPPTVAFEDPRPYIHFSQVPFMVQARKQVIQQFIHSLPVFTHPIRFMDIGCGDGGLTISLLSSLSESGKIPGFSEILLIDSSPAMIALAKEQVGTAFPGVRITTENARIQDCSSSIAHQYDIAMSSLAYHHMPVEDKRVHLTRLKPWIDHFLLFEMDANHDTPELYSPELALSVYQSYGKFIDMIFAYDAPVDLVIDCVDSFIMIELLSILTKPRGVRTDYHMLRSEWNDLFKNTLGPEFTLRSDSTCYGDEYLALFSMHYGREPSHPHK